jgi:hypothetical protein
MKLIRRKSDGKVLCAWDDREERGPDTDPETELVELPMTVEEYRREVRGNATGPVEAFIGRDGKPEGRPVGLPRHPRTLPDALETVRLGLAASEPVTVAQVAEAERLLGGRE